MGVKKLLGCLGRMRSTTNTIITVAEATEGRGTSASSRTASTS